MHRDYNRAGGSGRHNAIVGPHAVLPGVRRLDLKGNGAVGLVGNPQWTGDLLAEHEREL